MENIAPYIGYVIALASLLFNIKQYRDSKKKETGDTVEDLKKQNAELKEKLDLRKRIQFKGTLAYYIQDNGEEMIVCPKCANERIIPLPMFKKRYGNEYHCNGCGYDMGEDNRDITVNYPPDPTGFGEEIKII